MYTDITVTFYEKVINKELPLVNINYIFNGSPIDFAQEMCDWLSDKTITTANFDVDSIDVANGCGCLVAQYIKSHKSGFGEMYIIPFDKTFYKHAKFNYHIIIDGDLSKLSCVANGITTIRMTKFGGSVLFEGSPNDLLKYINKLNDKYGTLMSAKEIHNPTYEEIIQMMDRHISELKTLMKTDPLTAKELAMQSLIATGMWDEYGHYIGLEKLNE
jgi:hypothetical protein